MSVVCNDNKLQRQRLVIETLPAGWLLDSAFRGMN